MSDPMQSGHPVKFGSRLYRAEAIFSDAAGEEFFHFIALQGVGVQVDGGDVASGGGELTVEQSCQQVGDAAVDVITIRFRRPLAAAGPIRELSFDDRARWGDCPVCEAPHGTFCYAAVGLQLGQKVDGSRMKDGDGAHLARLNNAPIKVREVPV